MTGSDATGEVTDLLQQLIRNRCVNDGTPTSGNETRSVETLSSYLAGPGVELQRFEPLPGRGSLALRIEGSVSVSRVGGGFGAPRTATTARSS